MLPFILSNANPQQNPPPLYIYCIGYHEQKATSRMTGFPVYQLFFTRKGSGIFRILGHKDILMTEGTVLLLGEGAPHEYFPVNKDEGWELGFIGFQGEASRSVAEVAGVNRSVMIHKEEFEPMWAELIQLWHLINDAIPEGAWEASRRLYGILLAFQKNRTTDGRQEELRSREQSNKALKHAIHILQEHYNEDLHLANVARAVGYSVQHFHRLFLNAYGLTPNRYLQMVRLRRALQIFQHDPGMAIDEVAGQVGMETSYFIKVFKKIYGTTPKQYVIRYVGKNDTVE
ncbi:AraC family transcriptional regulator [Paenibacillus sp. RC67]|uniref:AraC family transcriptional regulator n=1 Tax=Paenibacillus sp. RC67 TaxID=3039392 RepID=UPI0024ACD832|nr:AraC family transcriptional regulator [Paenibacillus sp. RC67]